MNYHYKDEIFYSITEYDPIKINKISEDGRFQINLNSLFEFIVSFTLNLVRLNNKFSIYNRLGIQHYE